MPPLDPFVAENSDARQAGTEEPSLGPAPTRTTVEPALVEQLIADQFPHWSGLTVEPVEESGWDNVTFRLGSELLVRMPSAAEYALAVDKEHRWLPVLASQLPQPVPRPIAKGRPGAGYPFPWSVYGWLQGIPATVDQVTNPVRFAEDMADFVAALRRVTTAGGPRPGKHNWYRGGPLRTFDGLLHTALTDLDADLDTGLVHTIWQRAIRARWDGVERWFHGDLSQGNVLLVDGCLAAVLDFGTCGVGDPACDLAIAWTLLTEEGRQAFRRRLSVPDDEWARGRGWALWKALTVCADNRGSSDQVALGARRALNELLTESRADTSSETGHAAGASVTTWPTR